MGYELKQQLTFAWEEASSGWKDEGADGFERKYVADLHAVLDQIYELDEEIREDRRQIGRMI